ncbi:MAG: hypothetical protein KDB22_08290 [Planctomycetales bacterium]|nr:hypothetical protein [Planctomycetales bacterium]
MFQKMASNLIQWCTQAAWQIALCSWFVLTIFSCGCSGKKAVDSAEVLDVPSAENGQVEMSAVDDAVALVLESAGAVLQRSKENRVIAADLRATDMDDELLTSLASLSELTKLTMPQCTASDAGWQQLAKLTKLQHLDLRDCSVNNQQLILVCSQNPRLRSLRLNGKTGATTVDDDGLAGLGKCDQLVLLAVDGLWISEVGLAKLAAPEELQELYLAQTLVEDLALQDIAKMKSLRKLRLAGTGVSDAGIGLLETLPLEELDLSECSKLSDEVMASIGKMTSLKRLNLWRNAITDEGVAHLSALTNMEWLNLDNTRLSDSGMPALASMKKCTFMHLGSTGITDQGLLHLYGIKSLKDLKVTRTAVTEQGAQGVRDAIPGVAVQLKYVESPEA